MTQAKMFAIITSTLLVVIIIAFSIPEWVWPQIGAALFLGGIAAIAISVLWRISGGIVREMNRR